MMGPGYLPGVNSSNRTCQVTDCPGWSRTMPVSGLPQSLLYGSGRLNWGSMATKFLRVAHRPVWT